jgi:hypothetical protein
MLLLLVLLLAAAGYNAQGGKEHIQKSRKAVTGRPANMLLLKHTYAAASAAASAVAAAASAAG